MEGWRHAERDAAMWPRRWTTVRWVRRGAVGRAVAAIGAAQPAGATMAKAGQLCAERRKVQQVGFRCVDAVPDACSRRIRGLSEGQVQTLI